jgi:hypothetical protein
MKLTVAGVAVSSALLLLTAVARADTQTVGFGPTQATLTFAPISDPTGYDAMALSITRGGVPLVNEAPTVRGCQQPNCWPANGTEADSVKVADLDGDAEPEVVLDLYTAGAHCCFASIIYRFNGSSFDRLEHSFADAGYRLRDLDGDARPEFVSADTRFNYRFASFAGSANPLRVFSLEHGALRDVTRGFAADIRKDAARWWRIFQGRKHSANREPLGALAGWVGDEYLVGNRASALRRLRHLARAGDLRGLPPYRSGTRYVTDIDGFLTRLGYRRP